MPVAFKAKANSAILNNTFVDKTVDDVKEGDLELQDKLDLTDSGSTAIADAQLYMNTLRTDTDTNTADIAVNAANISANASDIDDIENSVGQPNGIASLDGDGKLPSSQLTVSAMTFLGNYDAATNTPALIDGTGNTGDTYRVNVAGTQDFGDGPLTFQIGDWVYYDGSLWKKGDNIDQVTSVAGKTGAVTLDSDDITEVNGRFFTNKNNLIAVVDPTVSNDNTEDYAIGSLWYNQTNNTFFVAESVATGAAVWQAAGPGTINSTDINEVGGKFFTNKNNLTAIVDPAISNDDTEDYAEGSFWYNQTSDVLFIAEDVTTGAAAWQSIGGGVASVPVFARAASDSGQTINTTIQTIVWNNTLEDTNGAYNNATGEYTAPVTGEYQINAFFRAADPGNFLAGRLYVNGVQQSIQQSSSGANDSLVISMLFPLTAGDIVTIRANYQAGGGGVMLGANAFNQFSIFKVN